jgi:hypothetical protein
MTNQKLGPLQQKWVAYLKKNGHKQGKGALGYIDEKDRRKKMCCLGAAGYAILKSCVWKDKTLLEKKTNDNLVLNHSYEKLGLRTENGSFGILENLDDPAALSELNDQGYSWYEIACYLEAAPELFFTEPK